MVGIYLIVALSTTFSFQHVVAEGGGCSPLPIDHFQWIDSDDSLVTPRTSVIPNGGVISKDGCCGPECDDDWKPLPESPSCQFCQSNATLVCQGSDLYHVPSPAIIPATRLSLYKITGVGLISLPPRSFMGLSIQNLVIENSNLSFLALDTFAGVKSITSLLINHNKLNYISQADSIFKDIPNLKWLSLEFNGLKVLSSAGSSNLHNLTYFSLAGNPLYTMDVFFLQNSSLTFLNLKSVTFNVKTVDIKGSGVNKLPNSLSAIDLSRAKIKTQTIEEFIEQLKGKNISTLNLNFLPTPFRSLCVLRHINNYLQFLTLKGSDMSYLFTVKTSKICLYNSVKFVHMKELNLEYSNIPLFYNVDVFKAFPNLTILSMAKNLIFTLDFTFLSYLPNLVFLDMSYSILNEVNCQNSHLEVPSNLQGVDFSFSEICLEAEDANIFFYILQDLQMLSFCRLQFVTHDALETMKSQSLKKIKYLDLSASLTEERQLKEINDLFSKINKSLIELNFSLNNLRITDDFPSILSQLTSLEKLDISYNLIREFSHEMFPPFLKTLNVSQNLITTWYLPMLKNESQLQSLDVSNNQITYISDAMIEDFYKLRSLSLYSNRLICHNKVVSLVCSNINNDSQYIQYVNKKTIDMKSNNQYSIFNNHRIITNNNSQSLKLVDWQQYRCYDPLLNQFRQFSEEKDCNAYYKEVSSTHKPEMPTTQNQQRTTIPYQPSVQKSTWNWEWTYFIVGPMVLFSTLGSIIYYKWWNIRCFIHRYISMKKARLLKKNGNLLAKPEVHYDVFVSYSDVDRAWVLDHLVPNMEKEGDVSLCFHERDFQVGLTILENIIECMDHSHTLLLVVSRSFIYSKWCQFEMYLAQYRLTETFRDQLVLVLLEDIPRKARPQSLHHLMMSKTYLVWPQQPCKDDAYELFWRRLKRALRQPLVIL